MPNDVLIFAALFTGLALIAAVLSLWFGVATALSEIVVGTVAAFVLENEFGITLIPKDAGWITFLAGAGSILLTFLAGAEIEPDVLRLKWKEATAIGLTGFLAPFIGCGMLSYYILHWGVSASLLSGVALSTTSVAVVYAVMIEFGLNKTDYGKTVLAACFINDLVTVLVLGFIFSPFTIKTAIFFGASLLTLAILPSVTSYLFAYLGRRPSEFETRYILFVLFGLGALATYAGSEAVLPAYVVGMVLAKTAGRDHVLIRRLRTLTLGLLTPFYFLRAGSLISIPTLASAPGVLFLLLFGKMASKFAGVYPCTKVFKSPPKEAMYTTLLMSTGLTFGTISALFGLSHHIIDVKEYTFLVAAVVGSAVVPTLIANTFFLPKHLISGLSSAEEEISGNTSD